MFGSLGTRRLQRQHYEVTSHLSTYALFYMKGAGVSESEEEIIHRIDRKWLARYANSNSYSDVAILRTLTH
jgi:hypothetical protein